MKKFLLNFCSTIFLIVSSFNITAHCQPALDSRVEQVKKLKGNHYYKKAYYADGKLYSEGEISVDTNLQSKTFIYHNHGLWTYYHKNGKKALEVNWDSSFFYLNAWLPDGSQTLFNGYGTMYTRTDINGGMSDSNILHDISDSTIYNIVQGKRLGTVISYEKLRDSSEYFLESVYSLYNLSDYDRRTGYRVHFYPNSTVKSITPNYGDGHNEFSIGYYENGKLRHIGTCSYSRKNGLWKFWHENGQIREAITFTDDLVTGEYIYYNQNGTIIEKGNYLIMEKTKVDFEVNQEFKVRESVKDGSWEYFDDDGKLIKKEMYVKGELKK